MIIDNKMYKIRWNTENIVIITMKLFEVNQILASNDS